MVIPEPVAQARGTQSGPFWSQKDISKGREKSSATTWDCMTYLSNCWWTLVKTTPQPKPKAARTHVHADGGRHHYAAVVTAEKVVIARQQERALTVSSGILWEKHGGNGATTASSRPRRISSTCGGTSIIITKTCHVCTDSFFVRCADSKTCDWQALTCTCCAVSVHTAITVKGTKMHTFWIPTGDTLRKAYLEECQRVGDGSNRDLNEDHI